MPVHAAPIHVYSHGGGSEPLSGGCSVTGGYVYRGAAIPGLQGWYLFGDYCNPRRAAMRVCGGEAFGVQLVPALQDVVQNLTSFGEDQAGELYILGQTGVVRVIAGP